MTICAECRHMVGESWKMPTCAVSPKPRGLDRITGRIEYALCQCINDARPEYGPSGDCPKYEAKPQIAVEPDSDFPRGIAGPAFPRLRAWLRRLFAPEQLPRIVPTQEPAGCVNAPARPRGDMPPPPETPEPERRA